MSARVNKIDQCWSNMTGDMGRSLRRPIGIGINLSPQTAEHNGIPSSGGFEKYPHFSIPAPRFGEDQFRW